jgi:glycine/D-amino acid oxidase-like deaminating enzyme
MTKYGSSPWFDRAPQSRLPAYPRHRGHQTTDVAVIGGGLTGCATAYAFAAAGIKVALVEAGSIGRGGTSFANGWIAEDPGASFVEVERLLGVRPARHAWQAWRRAALDFIALIRRLNLKCELEARGALTIVAGPEQTARLKREQKARHDAGLDVSLVKARVVAGEVAIAADSAIRHRDGATVDPYRAAVGLAAAAAQRGAQIFERSPAKRTTFTRRHAAVILGDGSIRANRIVIATGVPTDLFKSLKRHFWFKAAYGVLTAPVPAKTRRLLGLRRAIVRDSATPPHTVRWVDDERLLVVGADGHAPPPRQRDKAIVQRTGQLMYELSTIYPDISGLLPAYGWDAPYALTAEGLPYIGPHRNFPHHLFAFGDASHSLTGAYLASRIFLRYYFEDIGTADEAFVFTR